MLLLPKNNKQETDLLKKRSPLAALASLATIYYVSTVHTSVDKKDSAPRISTVWMRIVRVGSFVFACPCLSLLWGKKQEGREGIGRFRWLFVFVRVSNFVGE